MIVIRKIMCNIAPIIREENEDYKQMNAANAYYTWALMTPWGVKIYK